MQIKKKLELFLWATLTLIPFACSQGKTDPVFSEIAIEERPHFQVITDQLIYYYDLRGGGFSRIIDNEENDWVSFKMKPWGSFPTSASSSYRGLPNLVFGQNDDGAGHPGHEQCTSRVEANKIITESLSGLWVWTWEFHNDHAVLEIIKTDPERNYWFLYEGTPGGSFQPRQSYFGTSNGGPFPGGYDYYKGDILRERFQWMYAGTKQAKGCLYMVQLQKDKLTDMISFLGNSDAGLESSDGMTVFGFGREEGATPLMSGQGEFIIGLYPEAILSEEAHQRISKFIENNYLK